jgi:hypothetical protein
MALYCQDPGFRRQYDDVVNKSYFDDAGLIEVCSLAKKLNKRGGVVTKDAIEAEYVGSAKKFKHSKSHALRVRSTVTDVFEMSLEHLDYIPEKIVKFAQTQAVATACQKIAGILEADGDIDQIKSIMDSALQVGSERNLGNDFFEAAADIGMLKKSMMHDVANKIPTGLKTLDETMRGGLSISELGMIIGPTGRGKCFSKGTRVLMYDGTTKAVEDVIVGDLLMGDDSTSRRVLEVTQGHGPLYTVNQINGNSYTVNDRHVLSLYRTKASIDGKPSNDSGFVDIPITDYLNSSKWFKHRHKGYKAKATFPTKGLPPFSPYFMGLWLGDGTARTMAVEVNDTDAEIVEFLTEFCSEDSLQLEIKNFIKDAGLSSVKHIPDVFKFASEEDRLELLAGFIDADGHKHYNGYDIVHRDTPLIHDIVFVARSLGFRVASSECTKSCQNNFTGNYIRVSIFGATDKIPVKLPYKRCAPLSKRNPLVYGISVTPAGNGDYFGFEVSGNHRFLLEDFTVTHNSIVLVNLAAEALKAGKNVVYVTFELFEHEVLLRFFQKLTGSTDAEVLEESPEFREKMNKFLKDKKHKLRIKYFPPATLSATQLRAYLSRLQAQEGWSPDLLILDDADSMRIPKPGNSDSATAATYQALGVLYSDIISILVDFTCGSWVACQATRSAFDSEMVGLEHTADSFKKAHKANMALALCQTPEEGERDEGRLFVAKARAYRSGFLIPIKFNKPIMQVIEKPLVIRSRPITNGTGLDGEARKKKAHRSGATSSSNSR